MQVPPPALRRSLFNAGQRVCVAVSGGADSVALLRRLLEERRQLGIVLSVAHVNHAIRGEESDADAGFVATLAATYDLPFFLERVDAPAAASANRETLEEAARNLRYAFFRRLIAERVTDVVATAHTLDDQAETVLHKFLRGAWTEGLSGIHAVLPAGEGSILRPFLGTTRPEIEAWLGELGQPWREDATNRDLAYTRNRIRSQLLPFLAGFNPQIAHQLARLAAISTDEEEYWQGEMRRLLPSLLLPGKPARGGGRSNSTHAEEKTVAIELMRLSQLHPAVARRVLRSAARQLGARLDFEHSERLLALAVSKTSPRVTKCEFPGGIVAERTLREIRLTRALPKTAPSLARGPLPDPASDPAPGPAPGRGRDPGQDLGQDPLATQYAFLIPGEVNAPAYGVRLHGELSPGQADEDPTRLAILRPWKAGDRVTLRHSRGPKKVQEVLDRLRVAGRDRKSWPVVEWAGKIVWMRGVEVEAPEIVFTAPEGA